MAGITTTSTLTPPVQQSFDYRLLSVKVPNMIHTLPAMRRKMPAHGGDILRLRRYNPLDTAMVPLGNTGITPPPQQLTALNIDAKISWYGTYVILNEQVVLQAQDPVLNEACKRLGVSLRQTEDQLTRDMLAASAGFINCVAGVNGQNPTEITRPDIDNVIQTLSSNDAWTIETLQDGSLKFGSAPIRDAYVALGSTKLIGQLDNVAGFTAKTQYPNQMTVSQSEYCAISSLRFYLSSIGSFTPNASNTGQNVYNIFCVGMEAYAVIEQDRASAAFIYRPPIYDGPLALNASVGYKTALVPRITNDQWIQNLRCTLA